MKTFMPQFAPKVKDGTKRNTIRPTPKRKNDIPRIGDRFSGREWTGKPYYSKQRVLCEGVVTSVCTTTISSTFIMLHGVCVIEDIAAMKRFAEKDGFDSLEAFHAWFLKDYATHFHGIFIAWEPDAER